MKDPWHEHRELRKVACENQWLRGLLLRVASGLEGMVLDLPGEAGRLGRVAMWIRHQLWQGPPKVQESAPPIKSTKLSK